MNIQYQKKFLSCTVDRRLSLYQNSFGFNNIEELTLDWIKTKKQSLIDKDWKIQCEIQSRFWSYVLFGILTLLDFQQSWIINDNYILGKDVNFCPQNATEIWILC